MSSSLPCFALLRPAIDAHTLGLANVAALLTEAGCRVVTADEEVAAAIAQPDSPPSLALLLAWLRREGASCLGFSYRLDPDDGPELFLRLYYQLEKAAMLAPRGGPLRLVAFAGLPAACSKVADELGERVVTFAGDESPREVLEQLGIPEERIPARVTATSAYDRLRLDFGRDLVAAGDWRQLKPADRSGYPGLGGPADGLVARLAEAARRDQLPLVRAHLGPYGERRQETLDRFLPQCRELAASGLLDILSLGVSQLTQSDFGGDWQGLPNGGGLPLNCESDLLAIRDSSRPMLLRSYSATRQVAKMAAIYDRTIDMAWHALSLWWFNELDGRGPLSLEQGLAEHVETISQVAAAGKPFEANTPHHFSMRGCDDAGYVLSGLLGAMVARERGVGPLVLQVMLNTPKGVWGIADLARARALLALARELEDGRFRIILQPRAGLDHFSPEQDRAMAQLAAATALMDDIEPAAPESPPVLHVVSHSEGRALADLPTLCDSIRISLAALDRWRQLKRVGKAGCAPWEPEIAARTEELIATVRELWNSILRNLASPLSPAGLAAIFAAGYLPVPYLWHCRLHYPGAVNWRSGIVDGAVRLLDDSGRPLALAQRIRLVEENLRLPPAGILGNSGTQVD